MAEKNVIKQSELMSKGYGIIPKTVMLDCELSIEAKAIYAFLSSYSGSGHSSFPSVGTIIKYLNISKERYYKHRKTLIDRGYIVIEKCKNDNNAFKKNIYHLVQEPSKQVELNKKNNKKPCPSFKDTENPYTENPYTENLTTNINNNNINNNNNNIDNNSVGTLLDKTYSKVIEEYNKLGFGLPTPRTYELIEDWLKDHDKELIIHVMQYSHDMGKHNISYVNGILRNLKQKKVKSVDDFEVETLRFRDMNIRNNANNSYYYSDEAQMALKQSREKVKRDMQDVKTRVDPDEYLPF